MADTPSETAAAFRALAAKYVEAAELIEKTFGGSAPVATVEKTSSRRRRSSKKKPAPTTKLGRIPQLVEFLKKHGPKTRADILEGTKFPKGTLSMALNKGPFERNDLGLWMVKGA